MSELRALITDIEGTTTPVTFVHQVLFPYAAKHLPDYVRAHALDPAVTAALKETAALDARAGVSVDAAINVLLEWIAADRKATPLKALQGLVWRKAYESGEVKSPIYDDVVPVLESAKRAGLSLHVFSSGSVEAQHLLFGHSDKGDLRPLFTGWFDTTTGPKLEAESYRLIAAQIGCAPAQAAFLSDHPGEIAAAHQAGMTVCRIDREKPADFSATDPAGTPVAGSFSVAARLIGLPA
ncbi:MAG TPA: acireductone synthase [Micropepsaceae bacterium]|nr:acireductone synthase [Micropepsaceae bacterium]